jgi:uncharacterized Tic20 family protein
MSFSSEVITILDELAKRFGIVIDWTAENVMPYITDLGSRFVSYTLVTTIVSLSIKIIILLVGIFTLYKCGKWIIENEGKANENVEIGMAIFTVAAIVLTGIAFLVLILTGWFNIKTIIACNYIPETIIIDYIKTLL